MEIASCKIITVFQYWEVAGKKRTSQHK